MTTLREAIARARSGDDPDTWERILDCLELIAEAGWQCVPYEHGPTLEMEQAWHKALPCAFWIAYRRMVEAAPDPREEGK